MMLLTVQLADPVRRPCPDGTGYHLRNAYNGHKIRLQIGNVSIAFDDRDVWEVPEEGVGSPVLQFSTYRDDPVRLNNESCHRRDNVAETIMLALAADLGYKVSK